jgi:hypothetical protein
MSDTAMCTNGAWGCRPGYVLASSCPARACRITRQACCDLITGLVTENPCAKDGYRSACPDGSMEASLSQTWCVPRSLQQVTCISLDRQPCSGPAVGCSDMSMAFVTCECLRPDADASAGTWRCSAHIGP